MQISFEYILIWFNLQYFEGECFTPRQKSEIDGECVGSLFDNGVTISFQSPPPWSHQIAEKWKNEW